MNSSPFKTIGFFISLIILVVVLSINSNRLWGGKPEELPEPKAWVINEEMTLKEFAQANGLPDRSSPRPDISDEPDP